ncbi:hypothetical protein [Spiroplasma endosymbiont of Polydrusus cervinus]|uniref:hypothetical protein n=1 Tax=Spiroplasma endosymbiont of Polydrusus cervinus TaxID=3066287 RepID=UPI0030D5F6C2
MKKILSILWIISLITIGSNNLIGCKNNNNNKIKNGNISQYEYKLEKPPKNSNWKIVDNSKESLEKEFNQKNDKWYILIYASRFILKEKYDQDDKIKLFYFYNTADGITYKAIKFGNAKYATLEDLIFYRWDGSIDEPNTPIISQQKRQINWKV